MYYCCKLFLHSVLYSTYVCTYLGKTSGLPEGPDSRTQLITFLPTAAATENYPTKYQITKCDT